MGFLKTTWLGFIKRRTEVGRFIRKFPPNFELKTFALRFEELEDVWKECPRPDWMLWMIDNFEFRPADGLRLFACYCARRFASSMDPRCTQAIEMAEKYARCEVDIEEVDEARRQAYAVMEEAKRRDDPLAENLAWAAASTTKEDPFTAANDTYVYTMKLAELQKKDVRLLRELQAAKLRDLIGNPFKKDQEEDLIRLRRRSQV